MVNLRSITYVVYECPYCKGKLSIPVDSPVIRFEYCPVCKERIDRTLTSYLEILLEIAKKKPKELMLEVDNAS